MDREDFSEDMMAVDYNAYRRQTQAGDWRDVQHLTFRNWMNFHLAKNSDLVVESLFDDLKTGVHLIKLVETLKGGSIGRYNKMARIEIQWYANLNMLLKYLETDCEIVLVNVGAEDIIKGNPNIILGLIWKLIEHFCDIDKTEIVSWLNDRIGPKTKYNKFVYNLQTDFQDGQALCYLMDSMNPGVIDDVLNLPDDPYGNTALAMDVGDEEFGIPALMSPELLLSESVNEQCLLAYLSTIRQLVPEEFAIDRSDDQRPLGVTHGLCIEVTGAPKGADFAYKGEPETEEAVDDYTRKMGYDLAPATEVGRFEICITFKGRDVCLPFLVDSDVGPVSVARRKSVAARRSLKRYRKSQKSLQNLMRSNSRKSLGGGVSPQKPATPGKTVAV